MKCWWTVSLVSEYLILFLWKYVWHSVLTDKMWCELYNRTGTGICEYWDTATIRLSLKFPYFTLYWQHARLIGTDMKKTCHFEAPVHNLVWQIRSLASPATQTWKHQFPQHSKNSVEITASSGKAELCMSFCEILQKCENF